MSYEDELEQLQNEALAEIEEENNDTNEDEDQQEESTGTSDNGGEDEDDGEDLETNESEDDFEDDEELEDEDDQDEYDDTADGQDSNNEEDNDNFEPVEVSINGQTISLNSQEELLQFVKNGGTSNTPQRKRKSQIEQIAEQGGLSQQDLALLIDAKNGNKAAIAKLAKQSNIDVYEIDDELADKYQQEFQPYIASEIDEVAQDIMVDTGLHEEFKKVIANVPQDFASAIATNPKALRNFADHVKSGLAQKIIPEAVKQQMLKGGTFLDNYAEIGREMSDAKKAPEKSKTKRKTNPRAEKLKARARNHKGSNKGTKTNVTGEDIWNMSSEDFNKKYM